MSVGTANALDLADFLANYRKGALSADNWSWFESRSRERFADQEYDIASEGGVRLYPTNEQVKDRSLAGAA
jgi:hypothetical protein